MRSKMCRFKKGDKIVIEIERNTYETAYGYRYFSVADLLKKNI